MTDDLVERLIRFDGKVCVSSDLEVEAAIAIERLTRGLHQMEELHFAASARAEAAEQKVEKLREALREIEQCYGTEPWQLTKTMKETARAALAETESE